MAHNSDEELKSHSSSQGSNEQSNEAEFDLGKLLLGDAYEDI